MNFLFTTWEGGGNVPPALEAAHRLTLRGHTVRFMSEECNRAEAEAAGLTFVGWKLAPNRATRSRESSTCRDWDAPSPQEGLMSVIRDVWCGPALAYAQDVLAELRREPAALVVTCEALFGVMAACESVGQPFALLCPNVSLAPLPGIPPLGPGLAPARNEAEHNMHAHIAAGSQGLFDQGLTALNKARATLGLGALEHLLDQFQTARVELLATSPHFDFPCSALPDRVRYIGPLIRDPHWAQPWSSPFEEAALPLVTVGFSTTFQNHVGVLQNVLDALAPLPVRGLVTLGGSVEASELTCPANCVVVDSAPHTEVMREAALVVTHGGHGTVMRGLINRLPMLVIPHGRDQNDNAVRITERGAGLSLAPSASVEAIREACARLLAEASFREAARRLGDLVAADAASSPVVEELEAAARVLAVAD